MHGVWVGLECVARGVGEAGGRGPGCGWARRAWHVVWVGLKGVAQGVEEAGGRGAGCEWG